MSAKHPGDHDPFESSDVDLNRSGLRELFQALTAAPSADELAGEQEALAAFRASQARASQAERPARAGSGRHAPQSMCRRQLAEPGWRLRPAFAAAAAAVAVATVGAAYAQALPTPVQRAAYRVLGFVGVPDPGSRPSRQGGPGQGSPTGAGSPSSQGRGTTPGRPAPSHPRPGSGRSGSAKPTPGRPTPSAPGSPSPSPGAITISIAARQAQVPAGAPAVLSAQVSASGKPARDLRLRLQERAAGQSAWTGIAAALTSSRGAAVVHTAELTSNTSFRFTDGSGDVSATVTVTVVPKVTLRLVNGHGKAHLAVTVDAPLASPGDSITVQAKTIAGWLDVQTRKLSRSGEPVVITVPGKFAGAQVRAVLPATAMHAASVSPALTLPVP